MSLKLGKSIFKSSTVKQVIETEKVEVTQNTVKESETNKKSDFSQVPPWEDDSEKPVAVKEIKSTPASVGSPIKSPVKLGVKSAYGTGQTKAVVENKIEKSTETKTLPVSEIKASTPKINTAQIQKTGTINTQEKPQYVTTQLLDDEIPWWKT